MKTIHVRYYIIKFSFLILSKYFYITFAGEKEQLTIFIAVPIFFIVNRIIEQLDIK